MVICESFMTNESTKLQTAVERTDHWLLSRVDLPSFRVNDITEINEAAKRVEALQKENEELKDKIENYEYPTLIGINNSLKSALESMTRERDEKERKLRLLGFYGDNGKEYREMMASYESTRRENEKMRIDLETIRFTAQQAISPPTNADKKTEL